jgi:hypothetical protein
VTVGQQLRQEGFEQGRRETLLKMFLHQLRERFGNEVPAHVERRVAAASSEQLEIWIGRVLSAATLTELLAD